MRMALDPEHDTRQRQERGGGEKGERYAFGLSFGEMKIHLATFVPDATVDAVASLASAGEFERDAAALPLQLLMPPQIGS